jgi:hypothetical protein
VKLSRIDTELFDTLARPRICLKKLLARSGCALRYDFCRASKPPAQLELERFTRLDFRAQLGLKKRNADTPSRGCRR